MIHPSKPEIGHYWYRAAKDAPLQPSELYQENSLWWLKLSNSMIYDQDKILEIWPYLANRPMSETEYNFQIADYQHAATHRLTDAKAHPNEPVDLLGHNLAPDDDLAKADLLLEKLRDLGSLDEDTAPQAVVLAKQMTLLINRLAEVQREINQPFREAAFDKTEPFDVAHDTLELQKALLLQKLHEYREKHDMLKIVTEYGPSAFSKIKQTIVISEPEKLDRKYLIPDEKGIAKAIKLGHTVDGAELVETKTTVVS